MACIKFEKYGLSRTEIGMLIDEWVLSERDREIMKRRHLDGIPFERLAEEFDMSVRHCKSIVYRCDRVVERNMRKKHEKSPFASF